MFTCSYLATQVYIIGGDGTQKGASVIFEVIYFYLTELRKLNIHLINYRRDQGKGKLQPNF